MNQIVLMICAIVVTVAMLIVIVKDKTVTRKELEAFSAWMHFITVEAEELYGKDAGKAKLFYVYSKIVEKFPGIAKVVTIQGISDYVDKIKKSEVWKDIAKAANIEVED